MTLIQENGLQLAEVSFYHTLSTFHKMEDNVCQILYRLIKKIFVSAQFQYLGVIFQ